MPDIFDEGADRDQSRAGNIFDQVIAEDRKKPKNIFDQVIAEDQAKAKGKSQPLPTKRRDIFDEVADDPKFDAGRSTANGDLNPDSFMAGQRAGLTPDQFMQKAQPQQDIQGWPKGMPLPGLPPVPIPDELMTEDQREAKRRAASTPVFVNPRTGKQYYRHEEIPILDSPVTGSRKVIQGVERMSRPEMSEKAGGLAGVVSGGMDLATPFLPAAIATTPARTVLGLGAGMLTQEGTQRGLEKLGVAPGYAELGGTAAGLAAGVGIGSRVGRSTATSELPPPPPMESEPSPVVEPPPIAAPEPAPVASPPIEQPSGLTNLSRVEDQYGPAAATIPDRLMGVTQDQRRLKATLGPYADLLPARITEPESARADLSESNAAPVDQPSTGAKLADSVDASGEPAVQPEDVERSARVQQQSDRRAMQQRQTQRRIADPRNYYPDSPPNADSAATEPPAGDKEPSRARVFWGSPDNILSKISIAKPIVDTILNAEDQKEIFRAKTNHDLAATSKGLNLKDRMMLGELLDTAADPTQMTGLVSPRFGRPYSADLTQRAAQARSILDQVHSQFPEAATRQGDQVGYISNYLTHIWRSAAGDSVLQNALPELWDNYFHQPLKAIKGLFTREDLPQLPVDPDGNPVPAPKLGAPAVGAGRPSSRFVEHRSGRLKDYELDVNKIFPAYVDSAAKVIYDLPAVKKAQELGRAIPDGTITRKVADDWIRHYAGYERGDKLNSGLNQAANALIRLTSRSVLFWSGQLQAYHLARLALNTFPNLGPKYFTKGVGGFLQSPAAAWVEARDAGLIPNAVKPGAFKSKGDLLDDLGNLFNVMDFVDRSVAYKGYMAKNLDSGMPVDQAHLAAVRDAKAASIITSPARSTRMAQSGPLGKLVGMYKQIPTRIVEQYWNIARNAKADPNTGMPIASRAAFAFTASVALEYGTGIKTSHISPSALSISTPVEQKISAIGHALVTGDLEGALELTARFMIPGGNSVVNQLEKGQPSFMADQNEEE